MGHGEQFKFRELSLIGLILWTFSIGGMDFDIEPINHFLVLMPRCSVYEIRAVPGTIWLNTK